MAQKDVLGQMIQQDSELKLKVKLLRESAKLPTRGTEDSAGLDLYAVDGCYVRPHQNIAIHTGIAMQIPQGYVGLLFARSGLSTKQLLRPSNCVGVIDADYRGEIILSLFNDSTVDARRIEAGDRVAQIVIVPYIAPQLVECDELDDTDRGEGGFGSTGK